MSTTGFIYELARAIFVLLCGMVKPENRIVKLYAYAPPGEDIRAAIRITEVRS